MRESMRSNPFKDYTIWTLNLTLALTITLNLILIQGIIYPSQGVFTPKTFVQPQHRPPLEVLGYV